MKSYRRKYPAELRDALRRSTDLLIDSGVSLSTIRRLKKGEVKRPSPLILDKLILINFEYWSSRLIKGGVPEGYADLLIREGNPSQWRFEIQQRREIARTISHHKDDGKNHPLRNVLEGMSMSVRVDIADWVRYTKELYNEVPDVEIPRGVLTGVRAMTDRQRKRYLKARREQYEH